MINARVFTPHSFPNATIAFASSLAFSRVGIKAAAPNFTSSTSAAKFSANFLERIEAVISGMDGTVPLTSRNAYIALSAGTIRAVCPQITHPTVCTFFTMRSKSSAVVNPGIASNLSSVPPVMPSPRPEIIGTRKPRHASNGASGSETLSPTPPVECLSTNGLGSSGNFSTSPESRMAMVNALVSGVVSPRK